MVTITLLKHHSHHTHCILNLAWYQEHNFHNQNDNLFCLYCQQDGSKQNFWFKHKPLTVTSIGLKKMYKDITWSPIWPYHVTTTKLV